MNRFKLHIEQKLQEVQKSINELNIKIETLPTKDQINLKDLGNIKELKKEYNTYYKRTGFLQLIGPSTEELKRFFHKQILTSLEEEKDKLNILKQAFEDLINSIKDNQITQKLTYTNALIKELLEFSSNNNLSSSDTIELLLEILRNSKNDQYVDTSIKKSITGFYDSNNQLKDEFNINSLRLMYEKLFLVTLTEEEQNKYSIIINGIIIELKIKSNNETEPSIKETLLVQKENLRKLQEYISAGQIIKTTNIEEFKKILNNSGLDQMLITKLLIEMQDKIEEERKKQEEKQTKESLTKHLSEKELLYIEKSYIIEQKYNKEIKQLIIRLREDVISLCKYMDFVYTTVDINDSYDVLTKRISILKELLIQLESRSTEQSQFYYLTDNDLVPYIMRTIETKDISELNSILNLLKKLANRKHTGSIISICNGIPIYKVSNASHTLLFTKHTSKPTIIDIYSTNQFKCDKKLSPQKIKSLEEYQVLNASVEFENLNNTYEGLILSSLIVPPFETQHTLKKER